MSPSPCFGLGRRCAAAQSTHHQQEQQKASTHLDTPPPTAHALYSQSATASVPVDHAVWMHACICTRRVVHRVCITVMRQDVGV